MAETIPINMAVNRRPKVTLAKKRKKKTEADIITFLPSDITINILSRVPADSIIHCCRGVCKTWRALVDHPSFINQHTFQLVASSSSHHNNGKSSFSFLLHCHMRMRNKPCRRFHFVEYNVLPFKVKEQPITHHPPSPLNFGNVHYNFMGSCNGLVFLGSVLPSVEEAGSYFICNPFTREYINLLRPTTTQQERVFMVYGFGYHHFTNEYKVVSIHYKTGRSRSPGPGQISVYTLGSGRWRNKGEIQHQLVLNRRPDLLANGALYWRSKRDRKIVSFDLADEEFRIVPSPPPPLSPNEIVDELGVLDGCLCVTRSNMTRCESPQEIWVLNHNTNANIIINPEESSCLWTKMEFNLPWKEINSVVEPHVILKGGNVLLRDNNRLVSFDLKTESFHEYESFANSRYWFNIIPYTKSLVSLKALGEEDVKSCRTVQALDQKG